METIHWVDYDETKKSTVMVLSFLESLPQNIKKFVESENSNFKSFMNGFDSYGIDSTTFDLALTDAIDEFQINYLRETRKLKLDKIEKINTKNDLFAQKLQSIGFTGDSLKLKFRTLQLLWTKLQEKVNELRFQAINFYNNEIAKLAEKFFKYLNSILKSLTTVFPGLDALIEIKENIEAVIGLSNAV